MADDLERQREVYELRRAGLTLRAIGERFGISRDRVRQIEWKEHERRRLAGTPQGELSTRSFNSLRNVMEDKLGCSWNDTYAAVTPQNVAKLSRSDLLRWPNLGVVSLAELDAWLAQHGLKWEHQ